MGLITVGIGGNDAGWINVVKDCQIDAVTHPNPGTGKGCKAIIVDHFNEALPELRRRLSEAYAQIRAKAQHATVIVVGYPAIFEDSWRSVGCATVGALSRGARADLREAAAKLDDTIKSVVEDAGPGFRFVDTRAAFEDHRICSPDGHDWIHGLTLDGSKLPPLGPDTFHPNAAGQAGLADAIAAANPDLFG